MQPFYKTILCTYGKRMYELYIDLPDSSVTRISCSKKYPAND